MMYASNSRTLTDLQIAEIHYLSTEGCPCCKQPLKQEVLAERYHTSKSTVSRIKDMRVVPKTDIQLGDRQALVELRKRVADGTA